MFHGLGKIYNRKYKAAFYNLKTKSAAYAKTRTFNVTHLFARLSLAYRLKLQGAFNKLAKNKSSINKVGKIITKL